MMALMGMLIMMMNISLNMLPMKRRKLHLRKETKPKWRRKVPRSKKRYLLTVVYRDYLSISLYVRH